MYNRIIVFFVVFLSSCVTGIAQDKCGTVLFNQHIDSLLPHDNRTVQFENWISKKIQTKKAASRITGIPLQTTYEIPVVVHILHQGESIGQDSNIPDEQVFSQIQTLNEDFRRLNADASLTPADFTSVAADVDIEFVLAKQDPEGLPTNGILRAKASDSEHHIMDDLTMANLSQWPSADYLNIWVTKLEGGLIGFAQYPLSNESGLHQTDITQQNISLTDGAYIDYRYFGTGYNAIDFSKGRTLTHEVGHWLGLRHIWGDSFCGEDYCNDTPNQGSSTNGCYEHGDLASCGSTDMFQNYMDYTDDVCMNLFTTDQKDRMRIILENSPRRTSLLSSHGKEEPVSLAIDLGIVTVSSPVYSECSTTLTPSLILRNYGTNDINSFDVELLKDDVLISTTSFDNVLQHQALTEISLTDVESTDNTNTFTIKITNVNGSLDQNSENDCYWVSTIYPSTGNSIPLGENFTGTEQSQSSNWNIYNENGNSAWEYTLANNGSSSNESIIANYYNSPGDKLGENDFFTSPVLNLTGIVSVDLDFSLAYSARLGYTHDRLSIIVSTDCGNTFPIENTIYQQWAYDLSTTSFSSDSYEPTGSGDWQSKSVNFGEFSNEENVVIAFIGTNGGGNNIYIDDISITTQNTSNNDISISAVDNVVLASCSTGFQSSISVKNLGFNTLESYIIDYQIGSNSFSETVTGISVAPGKTDIVTLSHNDLDYGEASISYEIRNPNGQTDEDINNNTSDINYIIDDSEEYSPFRITFSNDGEIENWNTLRTDSTASDWKFTVLDFNRVLTLEAFDNLAIDSKNYFISPSLNVESDEVALQFDLSYAYNFGKNDRLQILASTNCGISFDDVIYDKNGTSLATTESISAWIPSSDTDLDSDWRRETVDLSAYGNVSNLRLAFVFTNQNGNNIYIDNMEMFHSNTPDTIPLTENIRAFPNPAIGFINIKFNYFSKTNVTLRLLSLSGKVVFEEQIENVVNQIYTIDNLDGMEGIYVLQTLTSSGSDTQTIVITK